MLSVDRRGRPEAGEDVEGEERRKLVELGREGVLTVAAPMVVGEEGEEREGGGGVMSTWRPARSLAAA